VPTVPNTPATVTARTAGAWASVLLVAWGVGVCVAWDAPTSDAAWAAQLAQHKVASLADHERPAIVLVGGSGTHFGLVCDPIRERLGMSCFNMGIHAGLGAATTLALADSLVRSGDRVVVRLEYRVLADPDGEGDLAESFRLLRGMRWWDGVDVERDLHRVVREGSPGLRALMRGLAHRFGVVTTDAYATGIDPNGEPLALPSGRADVAEALPLDPSASSLRLLDAYVRRWRSRGVAVVLALPWIYVRAPSDHAVSHARRIVDALSALAPVVHDERFNVDDDPKDFADSAYHLSDTGRARASAALAEEVGNVWAR